jgi:hypothetical protein
MPITTLDIEAPILKQIRKLQKEEGLSMGKNVSKLLAEALTRRGSAKSGGEELRWISRRMNALVDLSDKEAVYAALDRDNG